MLEPLGLYRTDGKRPDEVTMIAWEMGEQLVWDVTVVDALALSRLEKKHRRDGMSRLGTSRNVQWTAEGARKCAYPRFQNLVNLSSLRSRKFRWKN